MGTEKSRHIIVTAHMPESGNNTRASLSQKEGSLDFLTQWDEGDAVNLFTEQDGRFYEVEYTRPGALPGEVSFNFIPVKNISEDRKSCTIEFDLPEGVDADRPYKIFGSTFERGVVGYLDDDSEVLDLEYYLFDGIYRTTNMSIPLYCEIESTALSAGAKFKHFLAYEILHIKNNSDETITFTHNGFDVNKPWYHLGCGICFWPTYHKVLTERFKDDDSGERIEINAGETKDILSCYYPTGDKIENARLKATINGNEVLSSNTKSSDLDIEPAKAYHMYATWDGKDLKFGKEDRLLDGEVETIMVNGVSFKMIRVEGGTFMMGNEKGDADEKPVHQVTLSTYYIGETEVTQELLEAVMGSNSSSFKGSNQLPADKMSWDYCQTFVKRLNDLSSYTFRLPTEAEWEFAARGGNQSQGFSYSGSNDIDEVAWHGGNSSSSTHVVASKKANELGLYDMSGNVWEWCQDWYGKYSSESQTNPVGPSSGRYRVLRGGGYASPKNNPRSTNRDDDTPTSMGLGMRLVLELDGGMGMPNGDGEVIDDNPPEDPFGD